MNSNWKRVKYQIFDAPSVKRQFEKRFAVLQGLDLPPHAKVVDLTKCKGQWHLNEFMNEVEMRKGEGVVLRKPQSLYVHARSPFMLKVKVCFFFKCFFFLI